MINRTFLIAILTALMVAGCSQDGTRGPQVSFSLSRDRESIPFPEIRVDVASGVRSMNVVLNEANTRIGPCSTGKGATLEIDFAVLSNGEPTQTIGSMELPLQPDWRWGVNFVVQQDNPPDGFGVYGWQAFELDPVLGYGEGIKLFVVWGGNSISNPVIY